MTYEGEQLQAMLNDLGKVSATCMEVTGVGVLSVADLKAWVLQGGPEKPLPHHWVPMPGDKLQCVLCEAVEYPDDMGLRWCPQAKPAK